MLYDAALASSFADALLERGIYVIGFSFPVVPKGKDWSSEIAQCYWFLEIATVNINCLHSP